MIQMDGGDRLRVTLLDRMSTVESSRSCLTLEAILMADKNRTSPQILSPPPSRSQSNRSLVEVMQREHRHSRDKTAWKSLREKLRLKQEASSVEGRIRLGAVLAEERALSAREEETPAEREVEPARMSLMELLEENEGQMSFVSVDGEAEEEVAAVTAAEISCCVCMVRSKGAAFIPCGHTFCRLCSRELWVQRGNCPLCNTTILEVLDLF
ncbi:RING/U-box superfamily protein [Arabidopsis thaliana]|uniref:RING/U-box superfamily protein n=1 Tax=Arabidopsis thaliana TaxID=3702 RepID=A0A1I9LSG2_ARATH|nr:RING/U-box superfamily protein [Arabidopsis thaliana]ANM65520.1 RING/U-box superfamily protein [Arabidopsis thaliana]|eukprot:NP_001327480.1 RING/U-box superfamily protein [Arabidopsis thaliana]